MTERELPPVRPVALYEGPRVTLFRGWPLLFLVAACVGVGAGGHWAWPQLEAKLWPKPAPTASPSFELATIARATLTGPGAPETFPPAETTVINVWRERCPDCMPAFEAWAKLATDEWPVVNVAFGAADVAWSEQHGVGRRLVFDAGAALVQPLSINKFTTIVVDTRGHVLLRDSPAEAGFADRVSTALAVARHFDSVEAARALVGSWRGSYTCRQGLTALTLDVALGHHEIVAVFKFGAHPTNPGVPSGSFDMRGRYDPKARSLSFFANESDWIERPGNFITVGLDGTVNLERNTITGSVASDGCGSFRLER